MKKFFHSGFSAAWLIACATAAMVACTNDDTPTPPPTDGSDNPSEEIAAEPFKSMKATVGEETVTAVVDHQRQTLALTFDYAETFEAVRLAIELNDGWSISTPAEPDNADLSGTDPKIVFQSSDNSTLDYTFQLKSYAFPIADATKLSVEGAAIVADPQNPFLYTIRFEANTSTSVVVRFAEGALMEGASIEGLENGALTLEFGSLTSKQIDVLANGKAHTYTFALDMPEVVDEFLQKLLTVGNFTDKTADYAFASKYDYIKIYNATELKNMPGATSSSAAEPDHCNSPSYDFYGQSAEAQNAAMRCLGDCTESDFTQTVSGVNFTIITVDKAKVAGKITADSDNNGHTIHGKEGLIVMSGNCITDGRNNLIAVNGTTVCNTLLWQNNTPYRTAIAFDEAGAIHFVLAGLDTSDNTIRRLDFCNDESDPNVLFSDAERNKYYYGTSYADHFTSWGFTLQSVATAHMFVMLGGEPVGWRWGLLNGGYDNMPGVATSYNARAKRTYIGETEEKIIFLAENGDGVLMSQGGRVLQVAGCTNATATSVEGLYNQKGTYAPTIFVDGEKICGDENSLVGYQIVYDIR